MKKGARHCAARSWTEEDTTVHSARCESCGVRHRLIAPKALLAEDREALREVGRLDLLYADAELPRDTLMRHIAPPT